MSKTLRKTTNRKSMKRKSMKRKSMNRKSMNNNYYGGDNESSLINGCSPQFPHCVEYQGSLLSKKGKYCRNKEGTNGFGGYSDTAVNICKTINEVADINNKRREIETLLNELNSISPLKDQEYTIYRTMREKWETRSSRGWAHANDIYHDRLEVFRANKAEEIDQAHFKIMDYLSDTTKDTLDGYNRFLTEATPSRIIKIKNDIELYKRIILSMIIFYLCDELGLDIDEYIKLQSNEVQIVTIDTDYDILSARYIELKGKIEDMEIKRGILSEINDIIRKTNECCRDQQVDEIDWENVEKLSIEEVRLLKENNNGIYKQLYDNPTTPEAKVRLQTYKIGEMDKKIAEGKRMVEQEYDAWQAVLRKKSGIYSQQEDYRRDNSIDYWTSRMRTLREEDTRQWQLLKDAQKSQAKLVEEKTGLIQYLETISSDANIAIPTHIPGHATYIPESLFTDGRVLKSVFGYSSEGDVEGTVIIEADPAGLLPDRASDQTPLIASAPPAQEVERAMREERAAASAPPAQEVERAMREERAAVERAMHASPLIASAPPAQEVERAMHEERAAAELDELLPVVPAVEPVESTPAAEEAEEMGEPESEEMGEPESERAVPARQMVAA